MNSLWVVDLFWIYGVFVGSWLVEYSGRIWCFRYGWSVVIWNSVVMIYLKVLGVMVGCGCTYSVA